MAYINNKKFTELRDAANNGNEKAMRILQMLRQNGSQEDISKLVDDYYLPEQVSEEAVNVPTTSVAPEVTEVEDISAILDKDLDGLVSMNDVEDITFGDFLKNKRNDGLKSSRTSDYFKMYNPDSRSNYLNKKSEEYKNKFDGKLKDIDRQYRDLNGSLDKYLDNVQMNSLDDEIELNFENAGKAYNDMTDSHDMMLGLGRGHDEEDFNSVIGELNNLISKYGKKNVIAALNTLKSDNENYKNHRTNQIDNEISRYNGALAKLLG